MIDINAVIEIEPIEITATVDLVPPSGGGVTVHDQLTGKDAPNQHPASSIDVADPAFGTVEDLAVAVANTEAITVDQETIIGAGTVADPYRVEQQLQFGRTITGDTTIATTDLYKLVFINSVTDVNITISNMAVGDYLRFDIKAAGLPVFVINETTQAINEKDLTDRTTVTLERQEDITAIEQYYII